MTFPCAISRIRGDAWRVRYSGADIGPVEVTAATREQALEKMRNELRYRLELCPCTGEQYRDLEIELIEESSSR